MMFLPVVVARQRLDERRHGFGQHVLVAGAIGEQNLFYAVELGGGVRRRATVLACDQHMHLLPERAGRGQRLGSGVFERPVVVFGDKERGHEAVIRAVIASTGGQKRRMRPSDHPHFILELVD
jgi:hypothetical protein